MAFTSADLTAVETAIAAVRDGSRAISVVIAGNTIQYQACDLYKLQNLRGQIKAELAVAAGTNRFRHVDFTITWLELVSELHLKHLLLYRQHLRDVELRSITITWEENPFCCQ